MIKSKNYPEDLIKKIDSIQEKVHSGEISLLDLELVPIFDNLRLDLTINNLESYSKPYKEACKLLELKFMELQNLLSASNVERSFLKYLETDPSDEEISQLFDNCWRTTFYLNTLSFKFLESSKNFLCQEKSVVNPEEIIEIEDCDEEFIVQIPKHKYTEKMMNCLDDINVKLT